MSVDENTEPVAVKVITQDPTVPLSLLLKALVIGITLATIIPIAVVLYLNHQNTEVRLRENAVLVQQNENLTKHLNQERIERQRAANQFAFLQCQRGEARDTVVVNQNKALLTLLDRDFLARQDAKHRAQFQKLIQSLRDTNLILEPPGEASCVPPKATG